MSNTTTTAGTPVASGSGFSDLLARCAVALDDALNATWTTAELAVFLNMAIGDYSKHFPRTRQVTLVVQAGQRAVRLPEDMVEALAVAYPAGVEPPAYLGRCAYTHADFGRLARCYDVVIPPDNEGRGELWLSQVPRESGSLTLTYLARHNSIADPHAPLGDSSVPHAHEDLLIRYVTWQAALQLQQREQQAPTSNSSLLMAQYAQNARRLEVSYQTALKQALFAVEGRSRAVTWDKSRIY